MDVCKTDIIKIIRYLSDSAKVYDTLPGLKNKSRAWVIRQLIEKIESKFLTL